MNSKADAKKHKTTSREVSSKTGSLFSGALGYSVIIGIALFTIVILALLLSDTPGKTLRFFFLGPLQNTYYFGNMLNRAVPLMFGGLGIVIAMKSSNLNLGGEGQIYLGAFVTTIAAIALAPLKIIGLVLALILGAICAGAVAALSGALKYKWNTSELITSFLMANVLVLVINYLVTGPFVDPNTNLLATRKVPQGFRLPGILPPSNLNVSLVFALVAVVLVFVYLYKTKGGYELRMFGMNPRFALYGGISRAKNTIYPMFLSGALYGIGGGMAIIGTYYSCVKEFSAGMGWNGLAVALIAKNRPFAVIPAAIFFAYIESGAKNAMLHSDVTAELAMIVQAVVFLLVTSEVLQNLRLKNTGGAL
ncbi:MAG: ABC transporter permease [Spirochaetota bacterium]